jgi:hypothetical protein
MAGNCETDCALGGRTIDAEDKLVHLDLCDPFCRITIHTRTSRLPRGGTGRSAAALIGECYGCERSAAGHTSSSSRPSFYSSHLQATSQTRCTMAQRRFRTGPKSRRQRACADGVRAGASGTGLGTGGTAIRRGAAESLFTISCSSACNLAISAPICC